MFTTEIDF